MAATYDDTLPSARDRARFALGDTDVPDGAMLQDETYDAAIAERGEAAAIAFLAGGLRARLAQDPSSYSDPDMAVSFADRGAALQDAAALAGGGFATRSTAPVRACDERDAEYRRPWRWSPDE
jgi:hypothetical protein